MQAGTATRLFVLVAGAWVAATRLSTAGTRPAETAGVHPGLREGIVAAASSVPDLRAFRAG